MAAADMGRDPTELGAEVIRISLESMRKTLAERGLPGFRADPEPFEHGTLDSLDLTATEATVAGLWFRLVAASNDGDGHVYVLIMGAPRRYRSQALSELQKILDSWIWLER